VDRDDAVEYLDALDPLRMDLRLDVMEDLLGEADHPEASYDVVRVGGTNGKGSTLAFLASILREAGLRVGAYTSPHLVRFEERIAVDGDPVDGADLAAAVEAARPWIEVASTDDEPVTYFEAVTLVALHRFREADVDVALLEAGLGGRLDATNAVEDPLLTVVPSVAVDHADVLGDSVEDVAEEIADLVAWGRPLVTGASGEGLEGVLETAEARGAPTWVLDEDVTVDVTDSHLTGLDLRLEGTRRDWRALSSPLPGRHQARNAAVAVVAAEVLEREGHLDLPDEAVPRGVERTRWPGRLQLLDGEPDLLLDTAHNPAAAEAVAAFLEEQDLDPVVLFGALEDKDVEGVVEALAPQADQGVVTRPDSERAVEPKVAARHFAECGAYGMVVEALPHALETARRQAEEDGLVLVTGSHRLVGDVLELLEDETGRTLTRRRPGGETS
jgi:folylpolyglutamate synthase/dihydrofolate synthase